jgi:hypothetical protein
MQPDFSQSVRDEAFAIIHAPERTAEYRLCARLGIPSVAAIVHDISARFPQFAKHDRFKQWVGNEVAKEMRPEYEVVQPRGRVPWCRYFTYGAVWGPAGAAQPRKSGADVK